MVMYKLYLGMKSMHELEEEMSKEESLEKIQCIMVEIMGREYAKGLDDWCSRGCPAPWLK